MELSKKKDKNYHGLSKHPLYFIWIGVRNRCYTPKSSNYKYYGGRGITVCDDWKYNFIDFYNWSISNGYEKGLQIDRIDNNGNYEPNNCQYIDQAENKRSGKRRCKEEIYNLPPKPNKPIKQTNTGYKGIHWNEKTKTFIASVTINKKNKYLGSFIAIEGAIYAVKKAEKALGSQV
jgi:hypothetical protein